MTTLARANSKRFSANSLRAPRFEVPDFCSYGHIFDLFVLFISNFNEVLDNCKIWT